MKRECPLSWRGGWSLYRRQEKTDGYGDPVSYYDMDSPDYTAEDGTAGGVCWQVTTDDAVLQEYGEGVTAAAEGVLYTDVKLAVFDRIVFFGGVWELRAVTPCGSHRELKVVKVA